jgi:hypothetical protein
MTHFVGLANIGKPPKEFNAKELAVWIQKQLDILLEPYSEDLKAEPHIYKTRAEVEADRDRLMEERTKVGSYVYENFPDRDFKSEPIKDFIKDWYGEESDDDGNSLTTYNPRSKWDWYEIGGRWKDLLCVKGGRSDICQVKDLDFSRHHSDAKAETTEFYIGYKKYVEKRKASDPPSKDEVSYLFCDVPKTKLLPNDHLEVIEDFDAFFRRAHADGYFSLPTYVDLDGWHTETSYGWFGFSENTPDHDNYDYARRFEEKIKHLDPDMYLVAVDFHI